MHACGTCGESNPDRARFCLACGEVLQQVPTESRKLVTVLFADVVGSTGHVERLDPESYRALLNRHFDVMQAAVLRHGGTVEKFIGDAMMAVFGVPAVHEDDALRAVRAAAEIRSGVAAAAGSAVALEWRIGIDTGEVLAGGSAGRTLATGNAVNVAARLEQAAGPGEILMGATTYALVRDAVDAVEVAPLDLRGKSAPVRAFRLEAVEAAVAGRRRRFDLPFVGRAQERALVEWAARRTRDAGMAHLLTVYGAAGVGKSRLVTEVLGHLEMPVVWARCLSYGDGIALWPVVDALATAAGIGPGDDAGALHERLDAFAGGRARPDVVASVALLTGLEDGSAALDPPDALRAYVDAVAAGDGLILVVDDLHHAEGPLLDLLESMVGTGRDVPLLVVTMARPELGERRPSWAGGRPTALAQLLEPLPAEDTALLVDSWFGGGVEEDTRRRIVETAGGNALFCEELLSVLFEEGALVRTAEDRWALRDDGALTLPTSIHVLLASRIDALDQDDRAVLEHASICGERFGVAAVAALLPAGQRADVEGRLALLADRGLLRAGADGYAFRHHFVRDAVYAGLPRRTRARLHERHADWIEANESGYEADERAAHHLEQAYDERRILDPDDDRAAELAARAGRHLAAAGCRALDIGDMPATARLLERALALLPPADPRRASLHADRGRALGEMGDFHAANAELDLAVAAAEASGDAGLRAHLRITALWLRANVDLRGWVAAAKAATDDAVAVFTSIGDELGLARAWSLRGEIGFLSGRHAEAAQAMRRAEEHARRAGDEAEERESAVAAAFVLPHGPQPVAEAAARCDELLVRFAGNDAVEARALQILGLLRGMEGDAAAARAALHAAADTFASLGQSYWLAKTTVVEGQVAALLGDPEAASDALRRGLEALRDMGDHGQAATVAALLATCGAALGEPELADLVAYAREHTAPDDIEGRVRTALAGARLNAEQGALDAAIATVRGALPQLDRTDALVLQADAHLALAELLIAAGRPDEAQPAAEAARQHYGRKGHLVGQARTEALLFAATAPRMPGEQA